MFIDESNFSFSLKTQLSIFVFLCFSILKFGCFFFLDLNYWLIDWIFYTLNLNFLLGTRRSINDSFSFGFILVLCIVIVCFQCISLVFNSYCTRNSFGYSISLREYYIKLSKDHMEVVRGPFLVAQPRVVYWRDDLIRLGFFLGSCVQNSTLGHVVQ